MEKKLLPNHFPVTCDTDYVGPGSTFVAIKGYKNDGSKYIHKAIELGATTIILENQSIINSLKEQYPQISFSITEDARRSLASLSAQSLDYPAKKLKIIGITGTKGKTTTAFILEHVLRSHGLKTALFGTIKNKVSSIEEDSSLTTPSADILQIFLRRCVDEGVSHVVMEVSSHALSLDRVYGIEFDATCFTNLATEHMDFYSSMDEYFLAKARLFDQLKVGGQGFINIDDEWGLKLLHKSKDLNLCPITNKDFKIIENSIEGLSLSIDNKIIISTMVGEFNAHNIVFTYRIARFLGLSHDDINEAIQTFDGVPGRLQRHRLSNGALAFVDYAHNPSSMNVVLKTLRGYTDHLITIFGCGGDRDRAKRPMMGAAAKKYSDVVIVTNDNPRGEDPSQIIDDIVAGIGLNDILIDMDRGSAIQKAVELSRPDSIIAILGKGHEDYYLLGDEKYRFDDFKEIIKY